MSAFYRYETFVSVRVFVTVSCTVLGVVAFHVPSGAADTLNIFSPAALCTRSVKSVTNILVNLANSVRFVLLHEPRVSQLTAGMPTMGVI